MRMAVRFGKRSRLRFISHLDLQRFFQRALNRTGLPIAYSQGFNPHPAMAFASALALGWTSDYEIIDVKLSSAVSTAEAEEAIRVSLPADLPVLEVKLLDDRAPSLMPCVTASEYILSDTGISREMLDDFMAQETFLAIRKTKSGEREVDIRPMAISVCIEGDIIRARLSLTDINTLKPDLLIKSITRLPETNARIHRVALLGFDSTGGLKPLMDLL